MFVAYCEVGYRNPIVLEMKRKQILSQVFLIHVRSMSISYRNQLIDSYCQFVNWCLISPINWFLYNKKIDNKWAKLLVAFSVQLQYNKTI